MAWHREVMGGTVELITGFGFGRTAIIGRFFYDKNPSENGKCANLHL